MPAAVLVAAGLAVGLVPGLSVRAERAATAFEDRRGYAAAVLGGAPVTLKAPPPEAPSGLGIWYGLASGTGAVALAGFALVRRRLVPASIRNRVSAWLGPPVRVVRTLQSGHAGDYAAWFTVGAAALGGLLAAAVR